MIAACEGMDDTECWNERQAHAARAERARKAWVRESNFAAKEEHGRICDEETQAAWAALAQWEVRFTGRIVATPHYCGRKGWEVDWKPEGVKHGPFMADALYYASPAEAVEAATPVLQHRFPSATLTFGRPRRFSSFRSRRILFEIARIAVLSALPAAWIAYESWPTSLLVPVLAYLQTVAILSFWVYFK